MTQPLKQLTKTIITALLMNVVLFSFCQQVAAQAEDEIITVEINKGHLLKLSRPATSVVISDSETADVQVVSPQTLFIRGKKVGETSFYAIDSQDEPIISAVVDVTHNISNLSRTVKRMLPDSDVGFKTVDGGLVMDGYTGTVAESENIRNVASTFIGDKEKLVNLIKTAGSDQVMLKVKVVEMKRDDLKKMGVNLQNLTKHGNFSMQLEQGNSDIFFHGSDPSLRYYRAFGNVLDRAGSTDTSFLLQYKDYAGVVDALETQGLANVLAEPSLTTTSGQAASFLAGGQFPLPVVGANNTVTLQYQPFGVSLKFTPVVMAHDRISLTVAPEVSTLDFNNPIQVQNIIYPILLTRKASSVVELGSGDSFMLAGLIQNETSNNISKFPGLGDLPVLGALFRSTQFQNNETELVILVTPYIVHPVSDASKLQTPMTGYKPPSDLEVLIRGSIYRQQPMKDKTSEQTPALHGDSGFILE